MRTRLFTPLQKNVLRSKKWQALLLGRSIYRLPSFTDLPRKIENRFPFPFPQTFCPGLRFFHLQHAIWSFTARPLFSWLWRCSPNYYAFFPLRRSIHSSLHAVFSPLWYPVVLGIKESFFAPPLLWGTVERQMTQGFNSPKSLKLEKTRRVTPSSPFLLLPFEVCPLFYSPFVTKKSPRFLQLALLLSIPCLL